MSRIEDLLIAAQGRYAEPDDDPPDAWVGRALEDLGFSSDEDLKGLVDMTDRTIARLETAAEQAALVNGDPRSTWAAILGTLIVAGMLIVNELREANDG